MFHRRLTLIMVAMCAVALVLGAQVINLTIAQGADRREAAERVLSSLRLVRTVRGTIVDRKGRVLAEDRPCFDIRVDYKVITGEWAYKQARRDAYRDHRADWGEISFDQREALIAQYRGPYDEQLDRLWRMMVDVGNLSSEELERRKRVIMSRVQAISADVTGRALARRERETGGPVELREVATTIAEERGDHALLPAVTDEVAFEFRKLVDELPGVSVVAARTRVYPYQRFEIDVMRDTLPTPMRADALHTVKVENVGGHFMGSMREVWAEDVQRRPFFLGRGERDLGGYLPGDRTGLGGVESAEEDRLRGLRGQVITRRDTGQQTRVKPAAGDDVQVSIDIRLQARVRALMDPGFGLMSVQPWHNNDSTPLGTPLNGAIVIMEVDTGELLAMVSTPVPPARQHGKPYPDLTDDPNHPLSNRCLASVYPPGSTLKPIVYAIAATERLVGWDEPIDCQGHLLPNLPGNYRCWGWRPAQGKFLRHGPLIPADAIARSCNIYFYSCGKKLGPDTLVRNLHQWGFGRATGIGLPEEVDGILPNLDGPNPRGRELSTSNAIMMGIGQGPIAVPPIQVAAAHGALARGGYYLAPLLIRNRAEQQQSRELNLPPRVVTNALQGMFESANESHGTGHHLTLESGREPIINLEGVTVRAKTGTAQAPVQFEDFNDNGRQDADEPIIRSGTHSWFVCHVAKPGETRASYIVTVMVEYGGSGGRVSGPVANQVLHALRAEGYL